MFSLEKIKNAPITVFEYLFVIFVLLSGASMYSFMQIHGFSNSFFNKCSCVAAVALCCLYLVYSGKFKVKQKYIICICFIVFHNLIYIVASRYHIKSFIVNFMLLFYGYLMMCMALRNTQKGYYSIIEKYCNVVLAISVISLFFYVFGTTLDLIPGATTIRYNKMNIWFSCKTYFGIYFEAQNQFIMGREFIRNSGIFMEAPGFAMPLTMSLLYELFRGKAPRRWVCAVLTVTGITTLSTKVLITMTMLYVIYFFTNEKTRGSFMKFMKFMAAPLILAAGGVFMYLALNVKMTENESSFLGRMDSLQATIKVWADHPIFGSGFYNDASIRAYYTYITSQFNGITAGFTCILAHGGIWMMSLYLYALVSLYLNTPAERKKMVTVFLIIFFVYWFQSSIQYSSFMLTLLAMGLTPPVRSNTAPVDLLLNRLGLQEKIKQV